MSARDGVRDAVVMADVPVIDIAAFADGSQADRERIAAEVAAACEDTGFLLIAGHGVPQTIIDRFYAMSERFFELPLDQKRLVRSPVDNLFQGYAHPGPNPGDHTSERQSFNVQRFDTRAEAVAAGHSPEMDGIYLDALWPAEPAGFRDAWRDYFEEMESLARRVLQIFEVALGLPAGWFEQAIVNDPSTQAANYYSDDIDSGHDPSPFRFKAHVDGSIITILYQDDGPGSLQLHQRGRGWRNVAAIEGTFVVNIGELMERWTNDRFVATPHRVLKPADDEPIVPRISAPFFLKPDVDAVIAPIVSLLRNGEEPKYPAVTGRQWLTKGQSDIYNGYDSTKQFEQRAALDPTLR